MKNFRNMSYFNSDATLDLDIKNKLDSRKKAEKTKMQKALEESKRRLRKLREQ